MKHMRRPGMILGMATLALVFTYGQVLAAGSDLFRMQKQCNVNKREGEGFVKDIPPFLTHVSGRVLKFEVTLDVDRVHPAKSVRVFLYPFDKNGKGLWSDTVADKAGPSGRSTASPRFTLGSGISPSQMAYLLAMARGERIGALFTFCKTWKFAEVRDGYKAFTEEKKKDIEEWRKENLPGYEPPIPEYAKLIRAQACSGVKSKKKDEYAGLYSGKTYAYCAGGKDFHPGDPIWILVNFSALPRGRYVLKAKNRFKKTWQTIPFDSDGSRTTFVWFPAKDNEIRMHVVDLILGGRNVGSVQYSVRSNKPARIVGKIISKRNLGVVYTYYDNGKYLVGEVLQAGKFGKAERYEIPVGKNPHDIVGMAMAPNERVYTWFKDWTFCAGTPKKLSSITNVLPYSLPEGKTPYDIVGMAMNPYHEVFVWFRDGKYCVGTPDDLDKHSRKLVPYKPKFNNKPTDYVHGMAMDNRGVITWTKYSILYGKPHKLDKDGFENLRKLEGGM